MVSACLPASAGVVIEAMVLWSVTVLELTRQKDEKKTKEGCQGLDTNNYEEELSRRRVANIIST